MAGKVALRVQVDEGVKATVERIAAERFGGAYGSQAVVVAWAVAMLDVVLTSPGARAASDPTTALDAYCAGKVVQGKAR
jgi:hypothetical protein